METSTLVSIVLSSHDAHWYKRIEWALLRDAFYCRHSHTFLSNSLPLSLTVYLSLSLLSACPVNLSVFLPVCLSACLSVCMSASVIVYILPLSTYRLSLSLPVSFSLSPSLALALFSFSTCPSPFSSRIQSQYLSHYIAFTPSSPPPQPITTLPPVPPHIILTATVLRLW